MPPSRPDLLFPLASAAEGEALLAALAETQTTRPDGSRRQKQTVYDTFDWRLHDVGTTLSMIEVGRQKALVLRSLDGGELVRASGDVAPGFAAELPEGLLRDELAPVMAMRRLLPIVEVQQRWRQIAVTDDEDKIVARLAIEQGTARSPGERKSQPLPLRLRVRAVTGYPGAFQSLVDWLAERGLEPAPEPGLSAAFDAVGATPGGYSGKIDVTLDPASPAQEATRQILRALLQTMQDNHAGTLADIDSEYLHDFRVAVRRTRSALSQIKGVFEPEALAHYRAEFKWLGDRTGATRDMDVYLLKLPAYRADLPAKARGDLAALESFCIRRQAVEQRRMARSLDSQRYHHLVAQWSEFLHAARPDETPVNATTPILEVASRRIWKTFRKVHDAGRAIDDDSPAESLHALRIDCKKLRYLLEFFKSLYPQKRVAGLVKALKRLQDNLGDFNDYEVQQVKLTGFADEMAAAGKAPPHTLLAMGRLLAHLSEGQQVERRAFGERFERFDSEKNVAEFRALFKK